jgi:hypothetical protein
MAVPRKAALLLIPAAVLALAATGTFRDADLLASAPTPAPTPAVDLVRDFSLAPNQPWARAAGYLSRLNFTLGVSDRRLVKGCSTCTPADVTIAAEFRTMYLRADAFPEGMRVMGRLVRHDNTVSAELGFPADAAGDTAYLMVTSPTRAVVMYRNTEGRIAFTEPWGFRPNPDGHVWTEPTARWRDRVTTVAAGDTLTSGPGGPYGWMACANGCCQFYTPPPNMW